ncbi:EH protein [Geosmithia morbida]|uniref:EH protein n=1 Tax=Geosmithia morbida TaxID=1094350 RepID=A0A9P5D1D5_9HYPO|nr:EH protein [Geosmithia morbida]KAF4120346.1 EH protein [Geosmithia morbida]
MTMHLHHGARSPSRPFQQQQQQPSSPASSVAALQGASLAFHKKQPSTDTSTGNTARWLPQPAQPLSADSTGGRSSSSAALSVDGNGSDLVATRLQQLGHLQYQQTTAAPTTVDPKSTSFIAATLAASRSASPNARATTNNNRRSPDATSVMSAAADNSANRAVPSPSAGSLISMWETDGRANKSEMPQSPGNRSVSPAAARPAKPPKPAVTAAVPDTQQEQQQEQQQKPKPKPKSIPRKPENKTVEAKEPCAPKSPRRAPTTPTQAGATPSQQSAPKALARTAAGDQKQKNEQPGPPPLQRLMQDPSATADKSALQPVSPRPMGSSTTGQSSIKSAPATPTATSPSPGRNKPHLPPQHIRTVSRPSSQLPGQDRGDPQKKDTPKQSTVQQQQQKQQQKQQQPPMPPKPRQTGSTSGAVKRKPTPTEASSAPPPLPRRTATMESDTGNDVFVSAPTSPEPDLPPPSPSPARGSVRTTSPPRRAMAAVLQQPSAVSSKRLDLNSMTSAIVAGSLAARLSPSDTGSSQPPSPPPRTRTPHLRQTLRGPTSATAADDDDDGHHHHHHHKRSILRSNKHAHHEGSRSRWRDEIRPRQRKRYEAVWASNRGALLLPSLVRGGAYSYDEYVANVVVRDIWRRCRLPEDELAEVWNLVDHEGKGALGRAEFIVGMWLIDQRLRGRKIPTKVSESVWASAGNGLRVKGPRIK